jgi:hypothetical protein
MSLFIQKYPNNIRTISGLINVPFQDDVVLECNTLTSPVVIDLPTIPANYWSTQYKLYIVDKSNNASVNNITINAPIGFKINGANTIKITANGGSYLVRVASNTNYVGQYSSVAGGDCCGIKSLTNAEMLALINTSLVIPSKFYNITDALYTDGGVIVQGININSKTTVQGSGYFLNADYQGVGNYSSVIGFNSALGLWSANPTVVAIGDCVVWNNYNYKNLTGVWGTSPSTDFLNWQVLPKLITNGYILEIDFIKYNINQNIITYRADAKNNEVDLYTKGVGQPNTLLDFQWGRGGNQSNKITGQSEIYFTNSNALIKYNKLHSAKLYDSSITGGRQGNITDNTIINGSILLNNTLGNVTSNTVINGGSISFISANSVGAGASIDNNIVTTNAQLLIDFCLNGIISFNEIVRGGTLRIDSLNGGVVSNNYCTDLGTLIAASVPISKNLQFCEVSDANIVSLPILTTTIEYKKIRKGYSNWETTLDFTDIAVFNGTDLTINTLLNYVGIFNISGANPLAPVLKIVNMPTNHNCYFAPLNAQQCGFQHTLVGVSVANDLLCDAPASLNIISGRTDGTDFIEYKASGTKNIRTNLVLLA